MNRKEAISTVALIFGGTIIGADAFLLSCNSSHSTGTIGILKPDQVAFMDEVGETILPATPGSGGAKSVQIGNFMNNLITDCYGHTDQILFTDGMVKLDALSKSEYKKGFVDLDAKEKENLLIEVDAAATAYQKKRKDKEPYHYFTLFKQLTLLGYFTSKEGATKALRYIAVPGSYKGDIPYHKGDKAWAT